MKHSKKSRIATLMVHSSPLDQAGMGDAGGMNVYVVESAKKMAQSGSNSKANVIALTTII